MATYKRSRATGSGRGGRPIGSGNLKSGKVVGGPGRSQVGRPSSGLASASRTNGNYKPTGRKRVGG